MENRWLTILVLLFPLISCGQRNTDLDKELKTLYKNTVPVVSMKEAQDWKNAKLLDTREKEEFEVSHIPNAELVGYDDFELDAVSDLNKSDTIILYCSVGYRSERIGEKLRDAGYKNVFNLYGGIFNWKNQDGIVVDLQNDTTQQVHAYNRNWGRFLKKGEKVY